VLGADGAGAHVSFGGSIVGGVFVPGSGQGVPAGSSAVIHGQYGDLTLFSNGDYNYTRFTETPGGVEDKFVYVLADSDGSTSPATLTISIGDSTPTVTPPVAGGDTTTVYEAGLPARPGESEGSGEQAAPGANGDPREAVSGTVNFHSADGIQSLTVGGMALDPSLFPQTVVDNATGTLVITGGSYDDLTGDGSFTYTYTLKDNTTGNANTSVSFDIVLTDEDGDPASSNLTIAIIDDKPHALADSDTVAAGSFTAEAGNVITGLGTTSGAVGTDVLGADSVGAHVSFGGSIVGGVFVPGSGQGVPSGASAVIHGQYGDLTLFSNGDYSYTRFTETPGGVEDKFLYVLADGDGSTSPTTLTISIEDSKPTLTTPAAGGETTTVYEAGLPARPGESEGSGEQAAPGANGDPREAVSGTVNFHSADGIQSLTVSGVTLDPSLFPQTVVDNGTGTLVITGGSYDDLTGDGSFTYTYTLKDNTSGDGTSVSFDIVLTDKDGDPASSSLTIAIVDDVPHAIDDAGGIVTEDGAVSMLSGNVLTNDVLGADSPSSFVGWGADTAAIAELNSYGTLTQNSDGTWSYVLDSGRAATQALGASFSKDFTLSYTMQDADGDPSSAKLVITVHGSADDATVTTAAPTGPDSTVYEAGLPTGSAHDGSDVTTGSFTVTATDGIANIVVGGTTFTLAQMQAFGTTNGVVNTGEGTLRLTGYNSATGAVSYSYTLTATIDNDSYAGATPTALDDTVLLTVNSVGGSTGSDELVVRIVDDAPQAVDDTGGTVTEDGASSLSGNVLTNDVAGADQPKSFVSWSATDTAAVAALNSYGTLTQNANGTWTYVLDNSRAATQALGSAFSQDFTLNYTMQDADGDPSSAKLVITVKGAADSATVTTAAATGPDSTVYEAGLPTGSAHDGSHITTGSFTVTATDGIANIVVGGTTFTLAQMQAFGTTNGVVNTGEGTLRLTGYNAGTGAVSYSYTLNATIDNDSYAGATPAAFDDSVALVVNGIGGTTASDTLVVRIVDDAPQAVDDTGGTVTEDGASSLSGNVLTNDVAGADQPKSFVSWSATDTAAVAALNSYGTLTQNANGTWTYVLDNSRAATQALGSAFSQDFTLNYTMQDADGDPSSAKLVITVKGAADSATVTTAAATGPDNTVYEAGLPTGSADDGSHVTTGSFTVTATDGIANIVVGGTTFTLAQMQAFGTTNGVVNTGEGTLRLTGYNAGTGAVSYSYTLTATIDNDSYAGASPTNFDDSVALVVNGIGGTTASDTLVVRIVDDMPQAVDDTGGTVTEDGASSLSGNVLTNDVAGADQPKSFVSWSATDTAAVAALNSYGTLTQNSDGTWTYVLDNSREATQALGSAFSQDFTLNYTMQDADGDPSSAKLVITVKGAADSATVTTAAATGPDNTVYEAGLPTGSAHDGSHITTGSFTVTATDGIANIVVGGTTFTLAQMQAFGTTNGVLNTGEGTLRLTGYNAGTGAVSYSYTLNATIDNDSYAGATPAAFDDNVALVVNGIGGTTASDTLVVRIVDDMPTLGTVQNQQTDNNVATAPAIGTLHYVPGADSTGSMVITANTSSITVGGQAVATSQSGNVLTGYVDADHSGGFNAGDTTVFTLTVNPNAGTSGQYVFDLVTKLDPTVTDVPIGQGSAFGSGPSNEIVVTDKVTSQQLVYVTGWAPTDGFTPAEIAAWEATGAVTATQTNNVNGSTQGWGLGNNNFDAGEFLRFDFGPLADYDGAGGYTPPNTYNIVNASYATFSFFNFGANEQIIFVAHYTDGTRQVIEINGPDADNQQKISAPAGALIDWIDVYQSSGEMKLNLTNVGVASSSIDKTIPFTLQFTDNDGDTTATQNFSVHVKDGLTPATPAAPIAIDLDDDGLEFLPLAAGVSHDYGAGAVNTAWVSADDGLLVHNIGAAYDIVFSDDAPGAGSDLEGLRLAYDSNGDGVFDAKDAAFAEFGVWQDVNGNGHVDAGEVKTLTAVGIAAIDLNSDGKSYAAANGDVTVLGEASFVRTDGSKGTIGDAVFTTAPKDSELRTDSTTASGFNQALVAASLVAAVGAAEPQEEKQPNPTSPETTTEVREETATASTAMSEPVISDEAKALSEASDDKSAHSAEQPVQQASHGSEEPAPDHAALANHGASSAPASADTVQADQPVLGDHQTLLAQSISLPSFDGNAAAALAAAQAITTADSTAAEVVKEALGNHDAPHIDTLLAALPGGEHQVVPVLFTPVPAELVDLGHMAAAAAVFEAAIAAHEAMAVAHG
jgi:VCBS repeat-containing protein